MNFDWQFFLKKKFFLRATLYIVLLLAQFVLAPNNTNAAEACTYSIDPLTITTNDAFSVKIDINNSSISNQHFYLKFTWVRETGSDYYEKDLGTIPSSTTKQIQFSSIANQVPPDITSFVVSLSYGYSAGVGSERCAGGDSNLGYRLTIGNVEPGKPPTNVAPEEPPPGGFPGSQTCGSRPRLLRPAISINEDFATLPSLSIDGLCPGSAYFIELGGAWENNNWLHSKNKPGGNDSWAPTITGFVVANNICSNGQTDRYSDDENSPNFKCEDNFKEGHYILYVREGSKNGTKVAEFTFEVTQPSKHQGGIPGHNPCAQQDPNDPHKEIVVECHTALGDIPTNIKGFSERFLAIAIGLAGGLALILLVYGSIRVLTSSGNQQSLAAGRDIIIAAVAGLLFLIFSVLILRSLGIIIGIPFV